VVPRGPGAFAPHPASVPWSWCGISRAVGRLSLEIGLQAAIPFSLVGILPAHAAMGAFFTATSFAAIVPLPSRGLDLPQRLADVSVMLGPREDCLRT
jgi:hypothetical protein